MQSILAIVLYLGLLALIVSGKLPGSRAQEAAKDLPMSRRIFFVIGSFMFFSFLIGTQLASLLWVKIYSYLVFGFTETNGRGIHVTGGDWRHTLIFSNGVIVHGIKLFPLLILGAFLDVIFVISLWVFFVRSTAWLLARFKFPLGDELIKGWKALWAWRG